MCQNRLVCYSSLAYVFSLFKLDPSIFESLQKERVEAGDVIYIEANSGAVKVTPQGDPGRGGAFSLRGARGRGEGRWACCPLGLDKFAFPVSAFCNLLVMKTDSLLEKY